jgi:trimethylamine--corrinoid protein Co-methyltransferase
MTEMLLEPISPLQLPDKELDILLEFTTAGQPVSIGPMAMASGTAPATLAGVLVQENAEILAGLAVVQTLHPGTPVLYGSIPHVLDPRTSICSFGSPEQGLMALALTEIGKWYGFPVYVNVNLTDSKRLDAQAGMEKMARLLQGMLAGADLFGHAGIVGADHGGCLTWLAADAEAVTFARRIARGFELDQERLAEEVISAVGPGGNYLSEDHTVWHYRKELWLPGSAWTRATYDQWAEQGESDLERRLVDRVDKLLKDHRPPEMDPRLEQEIDRIVRAALAELVK